MRNSLPRCLTAASGELSPFTSHRIEPPVELIHDCVRNGQLVLKEPYVVQQMLRIGRSHKRNANRRVGKGEA